MFKVIARKARTLMRDPELAIMSKFAIGDRAKATAYLESNGVNRFLVGGREEEFTPNPVDLKRLHQQVRKQRSTNVMEFGIGFSTIALAHALMQNDQEHGVKGHLYSIDTSEKWIENTREKIADELLPYVTLLHRQATTIMHDGQLCHVYDPLPNIAPDFLLIDGPAPSEVVGNIRGLGFSEDGAATRPAVCADMLMLESTLPPGFVMHLDGRYTNMHFLRHNLKRQYRFRLNKVHRFSVFELVR